MGVMNGDQIYGQLYNQTSDEIRQFSHSNNELSASIDAWVANLQPDSDRQVDVVLDYIRFVELAKLSSQLDNCLFRHLAIARLTNLKPKAR